MRHEKTHNYVCLHFFFAPHCVLSWHITTPISYNSIKIMVGTFVSTIILDMDHFVSKIYKLSNNLLRPAPRRSPAARIGCKSDAAKKNRRLMPSVLVEFSIFFCISTTHDLRFCKKISQSSSFIGKYKNHLYLHDRICNISQYQATNTRFSACFSISNHQSTNQFTDTSSAKQAVLK